MNILRKYLLHLWHRAASENNQLLASLVESTPYAKVLDLGCDTGEIAYERFQNKIEHLDLCGLEIDTQKARKARNKGIKVKVANVEKRLPYKNNTFDVVSANQILEHLVDTDHFLQEILRVLKPNGYLLLATENLASWHNILALTLGWHPFSLHASRLKTIGNPLSLLQSDFLLSHSRHIKVYTLRSLVEFHELHGFVVEKKFGAGYYPLSPSLAKLASTLDPAHSAFIGLKARKGKK